MPKKPSLAPHKKQHRVKANNKTLEKQSKHTHIQAEQTKRAIMERAEKYNSTTYTEAPHAPSSSSDESTYTQYFMWAIFLTATSKIIYDQTNQAAPTENQETLNSASTTTSTASQATALSTGGRVTTSLAMIKFAPPFLRPALLTYALAPGIYSQQIRPDLKQLLTDWQESVNPGWTINQLIQRADVNQAAGRLRELREEKKKAVYYRHMLAFVDTALEPAVINEITSFIEERYLNNARESLEKHIEELYETLPASVITKAIGEHYRMKYPLAKLPHPDENKEKFQRIRFSEIALDKIIQLAKDKNDLSSAPEQQLLKAEFHFEIYTGNGKKHYAHLTTAQRSSRAALTMRQKGKTAKAALRLHYNIMQAVRRHAIKEAQNDSPEAARARGKTIERELLQQTFSHLNDLDPRAMTNLEKFFENIPHPTRKELQLEKSNMPVFRGELPHEANRHILQTNSDGYYTVPASELRKEKLKELSEIISFVEDYHSNDPRKKEKATLERYNEITSRVLSNGPTLFIPRHYALFLGKIKLELTDDVVSHALDLQDTAKMLSRTKLYPESIILNRKLAKYFPENLSLRVDIAKAYIMQGQDKNGQKELKRVEKLIGILNLSEKSQVYQEWLELCKQLELPLEQRKNVAHESIAPAFGSDIEYFRDNDIQRPYPDTSLNHRSTAGSVNAIKTEALALERSGKEAEAIELLAHELQFQEDFDPGFGLFPLIEKGEQLREIYERLTFVPLSTKLIKGFSAFLTLPLTFLLGRTAKKKFDERTAPRNTERERINSIYSAYFKNPIFSWEWRYRSELFDCKLQMRLPKKNYETIHLETKDGAFDLRKDFFLAILREYVEVNENKSFLDLKGSNLVGKLALIKGDLEKASRFHQSPFYTTLNDTGLFKTLNYVEPRTFKLSLSDKETTLNLDGQKITYGKKMLFSILEKAFTTYVQQIHSNKLIFETDQKNNDFTIRLSNLNAEELEDFEKNAGKAIRKFIIQYTKLYIITGEAFFDRWTYSPIDLNQEGETRKTFQFDAHEFKQKTGDRDQALKPRHLTYLMAKNLERLREAEQRSQLTDTEESLIAFCKGKNDNEQSLYAELTPRMINIKDEQLSKIDLNGIHPFANTTTYLSQLEATERKRNTSMQEKDANPILHHIPDQLSTKEQMTADIRYAMAERNQRKEEEKRAKERAKEPQTRRTPSPEQEVDPSNTAPGNNLSDEIEFYLRNLHDIASQLENIHANFEFDSLEINGERFKNEAKRTMLRLLLARFFFYLQQLANKAGDKFKMQPYAQMRHALAKGDVIISSQEKSTRKNGGYQFYNALWKELSEKDPNNPTTAEIIQSQIKQILNGIITYNPEAFFENFDKLKDSQAYKKLNDWGLAVREDESQESAKAKLARSIHGFRPEKSQKGDLGKLEIFEEKIQFLHALKQSKLFGKYHNIFNNNQETECTALQILSHPFARVLLQTVVDIIVMSHDLRNAAKKGKLSGNKLEDFLKNNQSFENWTNTNYADIRNSYWHDGYIDPTILNNAFTAAQKPCIGNLLKILKVSLLDPEAEAFHPSLPSRPSFFSTDAGSSTSLETATAITASA